MAERVFVGKAHWESRHGVNDLGEAWVSFTVGIAGKELDGCVGCDRDGSVDLAKQVIRARPDVDWAAVLREIDAPKAPDHDLDVEERLLAAWRASGMKLGKLLVLAADAYALGAAVSISGLVDRALVGMAERYVKERVETPGSQPPSGEVPARDPLGPAR